MKWLNRQKWIKKADITNPKNILLPEKKLSKEELVSAIRQSIIAENDAIILYETYANSTTDNEAKKIFQDIAEEEKVHVGEFQKLLEKVSGKDEVSNLEDGKEEAIKKMEK